MSAKKALLIINPISGTRSKSGLKDLADNKLSEKGYVLDIYYTKGKGDANVKAKKAVAEGYELVVAAGGDGTVNEVANALAYTNVKLGIIPYGSGNGLARSLGIPLDTYEALKIILSGNVIDCDRGLANGIPFYCTFGVGFDAAVSEKFAMMKRRGRVTYIRSAFREFLNYRSQSYALLIGDKIITEKALLIAVCNAPQYGNNAYIGPKAKLSDGLLDITVVHADTPFSTMKMGVDLMTGTLDKNRSIESFQTHMVTIARMEAGPVHIDGEPLQMGKKIEITCQEKALKVFSKDNEQVFRPFISPLRAMLDDLKYDVMDKFRQIDVINQIK